MIIAIFICITILLVFVLYQIYELNTLSVSKYEIFIDKIPNEFNDYKIVQISDLHSKEFGKENIKLLRKIDELSPDIIVMTGDIIDKRDDKFDIAIDFLKKLCSKYQVIYTIGNHEIEIGYKKLKKYKEELKEIGVTILEDSSMTIYKNKKSIVINGLNYRYNLNDNKNSYLKFVKSKIGKVDREKFNLLLTHDPTYATLYDKIENDLILCGHIHGGIINLGKVALFSPSRKMFPKYFSGMYKLKNSKLIVSKGLGKSKAIVRINNLPEIVLINLKSKKT